ncbi:MAG: hypothetical protein C4326_04460 [Ignavibacteria bacterium]
MRHLATLVLLPVWFCQSPAQITLIDDLHRTITLRSPAERVVSLAPSITETLFSIDAGDRVVGLTTYCNYPPATAAKQRVGGVINPSIETIVGLRPDLVLMTTEGNARPDFEKLVSLGMTVFVTNPRTVDDVFASIERIGVLTGQADSARRLVRSLRARADSVAARAARLPKRSVLVCVSLQPIIVVGNKTFLAELIERAGGSNIVSAEASTYLLYSREAVLKSDPDVLIFFSDVAADTKEVLRTFPEWANLKAFRRQSVARIDTDIAARPGPRIVDALELFFHLLHHIP